MGTGRSVVQVVRGHYLVPYSLVVQLQHLLGSGAFEYVQVLNLKLIVSRPPDFKALLVVVVVALELRRIEQVEDLLVVDLEERAADMHCLLVLQILSLLEHFPNCSQSQPIVVSFLDQRLPCSLVLLSFFVCVAFHGVSLS